MEGKEHLGLVQGLWTPSLPAPSWSPDLQPPLEPSQPFKSLSGSTEPKDQLSPTKITRMGAKLLSK